MHIHQLVTPSGVSAITITDEDFDTQWLMRQRLIPCPIVTAYAGYFNLSRADIETYHFTRPEELAIEVGYAFEDVSRCPICRP